MSDIYYAFIFLPILFIAVLSFLFQSSISEITEQQFLMNCPYPIREGVATNVSLSSSLIIVTFDLEHNKDINGNTTSIEADMVGTFFECFIDPLSNPTEHVDTKIKQYSAKTVLDIPLGWFGFTSDTITVFFAKIQAFITAGYLFVIAPTQATDMAWFAYVYIILIASIAFGIFMVIRGHN